MFKKNFYITFSILYMFSKKKIFVKLALSAFFKIFYMFYFFRLKYFNARIET